MDGLECVEICLSKLIIDNEKYRFDSEFFQKKYLSAYKRIKTIPHSTIRDELSILTDFHANGSYESIASVFKLLDTPDYAYMVRTTDLEKRDYIHDVKYVSERTYHFLEKSKVYGGEVIINKIGSPGRAFLMPDLHKPVSLGMNQFMLRMKKDGKINNALLYIFLNSDLGKLLIERKINGTVPLTIDKEAIKSIYIPCFSKSFLDCIELISKQFESLFFEADDIYLKAENQLMEHLRFDRSNISVSGITEKGLSESFGVSGRLDAEYYQPKYSSIIRLLNTKETVESVCQIYDNNYEPENNTEYQYIEIADVGLHGEILLTEKIVGNELPTRARRKVKKGQVVISSIEGSLNSCALITEEFDEALCSTGFYVIDSDKINSETLLVLFQSEPIQELLKQRCSGTILTAISKEEFKKMPLPFIDDVVQKEIAEKVQKSFAMRKKAYSLIKIAVKAVEIAIEQTEEVATKWLRENVELLEG